MIMSDEVKMSVGGRAVTMLYAGLSYIAFLAAFTAFIFWSVGLLLPQTVDSPALVPLARTPVLAVLVDLGLVALFGLQHSVMARPGFKDVLTRLLPAPAERATFVLFSSVFLTLVMVAWQPLPGYVWQLEGPALIVGYAVNGIGWLFLLAATFMVSHFDLFGLRQAWLNLRRQPPASPHFTTRFAYGFIRHPIMTGVLLGLWLVPVMSWGHLVLSLGMSAYVLVGTKFEERDLIRFLGDRYRVYRQQVPMFFPRPGRRVPGRERA
jgi:protein-S-isoprenylcysteine O-methyltransferase Ste14